MFRSKKNTMALAWPIVLLSYVAPSFAELSIVTGDQSVGPNKGLYSWESNGDGTFNPKVNFQAITTFDRDAIGYGVFLGDFATSVSYPGAATLFGDLDNDGYLDFFLATAQAGDSGNHLGIQWQGTHAWLNNGDGTISGTSIRSSYRGVSLAGTGGQINSLVGDVNGDGILDYVHADNSAFNAYLGDGLGGFSMPYIRMHHLGPGRMGIGTRQYYELVDIDNDGLDDIVGAWSTGGTTTPMTGTLSYWKSTGDGRFYTTGISFDLESPSGAPVANQDNVGVGVDAQRLSRFADVDGDGDIDYVHANSINTDGIIWAYLNNGSTPPFTLEADKRIHATKTIISAYPFGSRGNFSGHDSSSTGMFVDVDHKKGADYVALNSNKGASVYLAQGDGTFAPTPIDTAIANMRVGHSPTRVTYLGDGMLGGSVAVGSDGDKDGITDLIDPEPTVPVSPPICTIPTPDTDTDNDGITDACENSLVNRSGSSDALDPDSDDDGLTDGQELIGRNASGVLFYDTDGILGTDPNIVDTDRDRLPDYVEVTVKGTDPSNLDTDHDGYSDRIDPSPLDPTIP